jgi:hypothetical protein
MYDSGEYSIKDITQFAHAQGYRGKRGGKITKSSL